ncbi:MAG: solute carrier family 23 protein [Odoribacter sp.]
MDTNQLSPFHQGVVGVQFLFVAFGATVLVPLLVGLDPSVALFTAGVGTLIFHWATKGKSSYLFRKQFCFYCSDSGVNPSVWFACTLCGLVAVAGVYFLMSWLIRWRGIKLIERLFPPIVIGPVIILIGLSLAGTGVNMAKENWVLALCSLVSAVLVALQAKGLWKLIPIFCGIMVGYIVALLAFQVDVQSIYMMHLGLGCRNL